MRHTKSISNIITLSLSFLVVFLLLPAKSSLAEKKLLNSSERETFHLVLVPEKNTFEQRSRYKHITAYLSSKMEMDFTIEIMDHYGSITEAFINGTADGGFFGSFSYVLTHAKAGVEPIARPVWPGESSTYRGYIFVRKDSDISNIRDMKNKSLVLVDRATTAGYIFQLFYLKYYGIENIEDYFSNIFYAGSHDAAAWAVYTGEADIGGAKNHIFNSFRKDNRDFDEQMLVLAESPEVPSNGLALRKDINPALKLRIKNLLLTLHETPEGQEVLENFGAVRFTETTDNDYKVLYNMVNQLGIDLQAYPY